MCHAMQQHGMKARVAQDDFEHAPSGRIALEHGIDLLSDGLEHVTEQPCKSIILEWCV
jgi:hypothetical protein